MRNESPSSTKGTKNTKLRFSCPLYSLHSWLNPRRHRHLHTACTVSSETCSDICCIIKKQTEFHSWASFNIKSLVHPKFCRTTILSSRLTELYVIIKSDYVSYYGLFPPNWNKTVRIVKYRLRILKREEFSRYKVRILRYMLNELWQKV